MMKKIFLTMVLGALALSVSCKKDESEDKGQEKEQKHAIEGTWYYQGSEYAGFKQAVSDCEKKRNATYDAGKYKTQLFDFNDVGKCAETEGTEGTYTISGDIITTVVDGVNIIEKFSIKDNVLTLVGGSEGATYTETWQKK